MCVWFTSLRTCTAVQRNYDHHTFLFINNVYFTHFYLGHLAGKDKFEFMIPPGPDFESESAEHFPKRPKSFELLLGRILMRRAEFVDNNKDFPAGYFVSIFLLICVSKFLSP